MDQSFEAERTGLIVAKLSQIAELL